ncbi:hypothetical protein [Pseudooceanicola sp. MF1-13]|uniref:hypothetical protein n=1 Tax=Pseudooceanicola sp. MF1-13 TaxID=3379095 RepID=UPI0038922F5B
MSTFISKDIQAGLDSARMSALKKSARLRVVIGEDRYPILRMEDHGFAVSRADTPQLRGLVDVYDGGVHLWQCLIVAAEEEDDLMVYDFKRQTVPMDGPAVDFEVDANAPVALIPNL